MVLKTAVFEGFKEVIDCMVGGEVGDFFLDREYNFLHWKKNINYEEVEANFRFYILMGTYELIIIIITLFVMKLPRLKKLTFFIEFPPEYFL